MNETRLIVALTVASVIFVLVGNVAARPDTFGSPLPPVCAKGVKCSPLYLPFRATIEPRVKEPTPFVSPIATPQDTVEAVPVLSRVTHYREE